MKINIPFSKVEEKDDGTIEVWGIASSESIDAQGEIVTPDAMKAAIPDYMKFGAIREMHQPIAAGTALEMSVNAEGMTEIHAHVVDPVSVKKVKANVLKAFSIGGASVDRDKVAKNKITSLRLTEVSLVDRPANPDAIVQMWKADGIEKKEKTEPKKESLPVALAKCWTTTGRLSEILADLHSIVEWQDFDQEIEGDTTSKLPELGRAAVESVIAYFRAMVEEETEEMLTEKEGALELAAKVSSLVKVGARNSKKDKDRIQSIHDQATGLGAACAAEKSDVGHVHKNEDLYTHNHIHEHDDGTTHTHDHKHSEATPEVDNHPHAHITEKATKKADQPEVAKVDNQTKEEEMDIPKELIEKMTALTTACEKVVATNEDLAKQNQQLNTEHRGLLDRIAKLEGQPAPAKGSLLSVEKAQDAEIKKKDERKEVTFDPSDPRSVEKAQREIFKQTLANDGVKIDLRKAAVGDLPLAVMNRM